MSEPYDSTDDTVKHQNRVRDLLAEVRQTLRDRAGVHDASKLLPPEKQAFDKETPTLRETEYGTEEYKAARARLGGALQHHYQVNDHHPQYWLADAEPLSAAWERMPLPALIELLADWKASSERNLSGCLARSIQVAEDEMGLPANLASIFRSTAWYLGWL